MMMGCDSWEMPGWEPSQGNTSDAAAGLVFQKFREFVISPLISFGRSEGLPVVGRIGLSREYA
jgi:hypothetical protein